MSKIYDWWLEQICLNCSNTNEECICPPVNLEEIDDETL